MKNIPGFYGSRSGTNRAMAQSIIDHLTEEAHNGGDLVEEQSVIKDVYRSCYGPGEDSDLGDDDDDDDDGCSMRGYVCSSGVTVSVRLLIFLCTMAGVVSYFDLKRSSFEQMTNVSIRQAGKALGFDK